MKEERLIDYLKKVSGYDLKAILTEMVKNG